ncbi:MAG TPA: hypothetical protein DCG49_08900 [Ruminococcus sp.]|nr:hypothetical protein [Ruminococcus sp.]
MILYVICSLMLNLLYCTNIFQICRLYDDAPHKKSSLILVGFQFICCIFSRSTASIPELLLPCLAATVLTYLLLVINPVIFLRHKKQAAYVAVTLLVIDSICQSLLQLLLNCFSAKLVSPLLLKAFSILLNLVLLLFLLRMSEQRRVQIQEIILFIPNHLYILILITLFLMELLCAVSVFELKNTDFKNAIIVTTSFLLLPMVAVIIVLLFRNFSSKHYYEHTSDLMKNQLESQIQHYQKMDRNAYNRRAFLHDYRNHLLVIRSILQSGDSENAVRLVSELIEKSGAFSGSRGSFRSGNDVADAILENKCAAAADHQIGFQFEGVLSPDIPVFQLCTILSNALDNAIEACEHVQPDAKPAVSVQAAVAQQFQVLIISNPHANQTPSLKTTKEDKDAHGFGLYNIQKSVNDLGGNMDIRFLPDTYTIEIEFPLTPDLRKAGNQEPARA